MVDLDKHDDLHTPTFGEIIRRVERLEKINDTDIKTMKEAVSHLSIGFSAIKWLALSVFGTGFTVIISAIVDGVMK